MPIEKISKILNPNFRSGVGAKGEWMLMQIMTDKDNTATIFAPASIGEEVILTYNEQYKNFSAAKATPANKEKAGMAEQLNRIEKMLDELVSRIPGKLKEPVNDGFLDVGEDKPVYGD